MFHDERAVTSTMSRASLAAAAAAAAASAPPALRRRMLRKNAIESAAAMPTLSSPLLFSSTASVLNQHSRTRIMHNTEGRENRTQELHVACRKVSVQNSDLPNSTEQRARNEAHMLYFSASEAEL